MVLDAIYKWDQARNQLGEPGNCLPPEIFKNMFAC